MQRGCARWYLALLFTILAIIIHAAHGISSSMRFERALRGEPSSDTVPALGAPPPLGLNPTSTASQPRETTVSPVETPTPPVETTAPPVDTTAPPADTTAPLVTTEPPVETTAPPVNTTAPPADTTAQPVITTEPPVNTTEPPVETATPSVETTAPHLTRSPSLSHVEASPAFTPRPRDPEGDTQGSTEELLSPSTPPKSLRTSAPPLTVALIVLETNAPTSSRIKAAFDKKDKEDNVTVQTEPQDNVGDWEQTVHSEKYVRGKTPIDDMNAPWKSMTGNHSEANSVHNQPLIIGGRNRGTASVAGTPYVDVGTNFHRPVRYIASTVSAMSVVLLLALHFVSLDSTLRWPSLAWSPNTWEFCVYAIYLQQMTSVSELTLLRSPYFLWDFTDAFTWTKLLIPHTPQSSQSTQRRRLDSVPVLDGLVGFADRIGLKETKLLRLTVMGFAITIAALLVGIGITAVIAYRFRTTSPESRASTIAYRLLGLCGLVWFFSVYPLSIMASFEITMEIYSGLFSPCLLALAILTVTVGCVFMLALLTRAVLRKTEHELRDYKHIAIFGAFYLGSRHSARLFLVLSIFLQLVAGLSIGVLNSNRLLLSILISVHCLYILAIVWVKPFTNTTLRNAAVAVSAVVIANFSLSFAFVRGAIMSRTRRVAFATTFIALNTIVLVLWFARHLVLFTNAVKGIRRRNDVDHRDHAPVFQSDLEIAKLHSTSRSVSDDILLWRVDWSRSMSLSGSFPATWVNDTSPAWARATPRAEYAAVTDV